MVLVDSSVWIEVFRSGSTLDLTAIVDIDEVTTCLPVIQEILQGIRDDRAHRVARDSLFAFPIVESPLSADVFVEAAQLFRAARRAGRQVRSGVDCLIAACALRHGLTVVHRDRDFETLAEVADLRTLRA